MFLLNGSCGTYKPFSKISEMSQTAQDKTKEPSVNFPKSPVCLIAGVAGALGANLCESLLIQNCKVFGIDDFSTGSEDNIENFSSNKLFTLINHDINLGLPKELPKLDYIFHLAGIEEFLNNQNLSLKNLIVNSVGTENLIKKALADKSVFTLVSTIDIYSGILSSLSLDNYFGTTTKEIGHYTHHEAKRFAEALTAEYYKLENLNARIIRVADLYGPKMNLQSGSDLAVIFNSVLENQNIKIYSDGLKMIHPTYFADAVYGIIKASFGKDTAGLIFSLVNPEESSVLNFGYAAKKIASQTQPEFQGEVIFDNGQHYQTVPTEKIDLGNAEEVLAWQPKFKIEEGIKLTIDYFLKKGNRKFSQSKEPKEDQIKNQQKNGFNFLSFKKGNNQNLDLKKDNDQVIKSKKHSHKILIFALSLFFIFLVLFPVRIATEMYLATKWVVDAKSYLKAGDFQKAKSDSTKAFWLFDKLKLELEYESKILPEYYRQNLIRAATIALNSSSIISNFAELGPEFNAFSKQVIDPQSDYNQLKSNYESIKANVNYLNSQLAIIVAVGNDLDNNFLKSKKIADKISNTKAEIISTKNYLQDVENLLILYPKIGGFESRKRYLFLLQNNLEIRPTGGFIGSYGVIDFDKGHITKITIDDIYNIDGQLKESIPPPDPLKKNLKVDRLYLRDSNWNPDFPSSVLVIKDLFKKETGQEVDSVIALNVSVIKSILGQIGSIKLDSYNDTISDKNLYEKSLFHVEIGFTPGSQQKKNFLSELSNQLLAKLLDKNTNLNLSNLFFEIYQEMNQHSILINHNNSDIQQFIEDKNWSGKIKSQTAGKTNFDYLQINDANVGANKANLYIDKKIFFEPTIKRDGDLLTELVVIYKNNSPADTWPGGLYKNYLQVLVPPGSVLQSIENGQNKDFSQVTVSTVADKTSFGFLVEVEPQKEKRIILKYKPAVFLPFENDQANYDLYIQKQSGTKDDIFELKVNYPSYFVFESSQPQGQLSTQTVIYKTKLEVDRTFGIQFKKGST